MSNERKQRPSIAGAALDAETGLDGETDGAKALRALYVMRDRGLISAQEFEHRRLSLEKEQSG